MFHRWLACNVISPIPPQTILIDQIILSSRDLFTFDVSNNMLKNKIIIVRLKAKICEIQLT